MKKLIDSSLDWKSIGEHDTNEYHYSIERAVINKDTSTLNINLRLNFVIPYLEQEKLEAIIKNQISLLQDVIFNYTYEDVILTREEIIKNFIPHMIHIVNGKYASITKTINTDSFTYNNGNLQLLALGELATEELNKSVSEKFELLLKKNFDMDIKVLFINNENLYSKTQEDMRKKEEEAAREVVEASKNAKPATKPETAKPAFAGNGPQGGWQSATEGKPAYRRREKETPAQGNHIMGKAITGDVTELQALTPELGTVVIEGILFKKSARTIKNEKKLVTILITDKKTTVCVKAFTSDNKWEEIDSLLSKGDFVRIKGEAQWDTYDNSLTVMAKDIEKGQAFRREDNYEGLKRVELHAHTKMSAMDGLNEVADLVRTAAFWGQPAVAITDHGVVQGFPDAAKTAGDLKKKEDIDIKVIYGLEGYVFDDKDCIGKDGVIDYKKKPTNHIIILAKSQEGLKNIYKLVSYSHIDYFYKRPRLPKSVIAAHREGLIIGSACEAGEVFRAVLDGLDQDKIEETAGFYDYLEIQPIINNQFLIENGTVADKDGLRDLNRKIVALADKLGKPIVATTDAHYDEPEAAIYRNILMAGQGYKDAENGQGLYMRTTQEMLDEFSYLGESMAYKVVVENTNLIAGLIEDGIRPVPKGKFPPRIENAENTLRDSCIKKAHEIYGDPLPERIQLRLDTELNSIISNGYAVMYVSAQMLVNKSLSDGYLVGSRGSVGSSLAATMAGITEVNPLEPHYICPKCKKLIWGDMNLYDCGVDMPDMECPDCKTPMNKDGFTIPFATFLGFKGDKEPDIDLNFAGEYQPIAHKYVGQIFGEKNVFKAGTVGTVADKTAYGFVMKYYEERQQPINKYEADRLATCCTGVKRTTGQHPGGIVIVPDDHEIYEFCPVQHPANDTTSDIITTHFDYHKIDENLLKLDILGHDVPSMIRQLQDMTGVDPHSVSLSDRKVLGLFNGIEGLDIKDPEYKFTHGSYAIPEFGTKFVRQMLDDTKPDKFADLVRISGFSHGTDVWLNNAQDYIRSGEATMREVISTRDDIMNYLILKGIENSTSFQIMEDVRKNRPLKDEQLAVMKEHDVPDWYIDSCIKIQYMFPRAHAVAYVMMSYRMAWYKVYYPVEFYATYFTSKASDFDAETIMKGQKAVFDKIELIGAKGKNATKKEEDQMTVLEVAYEMYARGYEFTPAVLGKSHALKFWIEDGKVLLPFVALEGMGETAAKSLADEYRIKQFDTIEEAIKRAKLNKTAVEVLKTHGVFVGLPETDQLSLF